MIYKKLILDYFKQNKLIVLSYFISILLTYPFEVILLPKIYSKLINKVRDGKFGTNSLNKFSFTKLNILESIKKESILGIVILLFILQIIFSVIDRIKNYIHSVMYPRYKMWLRDQIFRKTLANKSDNFSEIKVGKEVMQLEDIVFTIKEMFAYLLVNFIPLIVISITLIIYLLTIDVNIGIIMTIEILIIALLIVIFYKKIEKLTFRRVKSYFNIADNIDNSYTNISNILINNTDDMEAKKNNKLSEKYKNTNIESDIFLNNLSFLIRITIIITFSIIIIYSYKKVLNKEIDSLKFTTIILVMMYFLNFLIKQTWYLTSSIDRLAQMKYHEIFLKEILNDNNNKNNKKNFITKGKIEFRNVLFKYKIKIEEDTKNENDNETNNENKNQKENENNNENKHKDKIILKNFNLVINPYEKIGIMGKSGSGKSTLMKILIKFFRVNEGKVLIDNIDIQKINTKYLRDNITYINQNTQLFDNTIYYNIIYGSNSSQTIFPSPSGSLLQAPNSSDLDKIDAEEKTKIDTILKKYDLYSIYNKLPNHLNTIAGPRGTNLSLGMQKVSIILRGILRPSKIIILDEPLAGLDQKTRNKIIKLIINETKNKTLLIITHDKEIIPHMDRVVDINNLNN